jgi:hypothetical protein
VNPNSLRSRSVFALGGALALLVGAGWTLNTAWFVSMSEETRGKVVELVQRSEYRGRMRVIPVIEFKDVIGRSHRLLELDAFGAEGAFPIGKTVPILYSVTNPDQARVRSFRTLWLIPCVITLLGLILVIPGVVGGLLRRKRPYPENSAVNQ